MARFSNTPSLPKTSAPASIGASPTPMLTHQGGAGFAPSDPHAELFNAAISGMLADGFFESGDKRIERIVALVPQCDPQWLQGFIPWIRSGANLRSASVVLAAEYAHAGFPNARQVVAAALQRADEPGEMLGYWTSRHGRKIPSRIQRGVSDAMQRLYTQRALTRWDGQSKGWRFGDVIEMVHPIPANHEQSVLYKYALDRRRHSDEAVPEELGFVRQVLDLEGLPERLRPASLSVAARVMSHERLAGWLPGGMTAEAWDLLLESGSLGLFAILRNLNNFDRKGIKRTDIVMAKLTDEVEIRKSGVLPFRFLTAYKALEADTYKVALGSAADIALGNLPALSGRTLIMVDCSGSMSAAVGAGKSRMPLRQSELAGFWAEALGRRCDHADIVCYDTAVISKHSPRTHAGVLRSAASNAYSPRGGTMTWSCTEESYSGHDRVIIITDEQTADQEHGTIKVPVITWNLAGYRPQQAKHGQANRFFVGGYSDSAMQALPHIIGGTGKWPWEQND